MLDTRVQLFRAQPQQQNQQESELTPEQKAQAQADADAAAATAAAKAQADKGFPAETPVAEMTPEQQAAYWKFQSRKHQTRAETYAAFGEPDAVKAKIAAHEAAELAKLTPSEQAIAAAQKNGETAAETRILTRAATAIFKSGLMARGMEADDITDLVDGFNASAFIADGDVDTDKVHNYLTRIGGIDPNNGTTLRGPDMGQGRRERVPQEAGAAGKAEAAKRYPKQQ